MKKTLLLGTTLLLGFSVFAQQPKAKVTNSVTTSISKKNEAYVRLKPMTGAEAIQQVKKSGTKATVAAKYPSMNSVMTSTTVTIGETQYDLQTNATMGRRIRLHADGSISAVWTICPGSAPYTLRGTGYNYMDPSGIWQHPTASGIVQNRLESYRTGFPDLGLLTGTKDVVVCHETNGYTISAGTNSAKGVVPFAFYQTQATVPGGATGQGAIWPRIAVGGPGDSSMHIIANYADTNDVINGVKSPMVYSRSQNGGISFDIQAITLPGYDTAQTHYGGGEDYSIDAVGNTVAIVNGGLGEHVRLWKSTDNGTTFNLTLVDSFPYAPDYSTLAPIGYDSIPTNDGSVSVLVDNTGKTHVAFAYSEVGLDGTGASVFRPGSIGLIYWNDQTQTQVNIPITLGAVDTDLDGIYYVGTLTTDANAARYRNASILTMPSLGMDAAGNIFIVFSLPADNDITPDDQSYRDIWAVSSSDGGATWTDAVNLTNTLSIEESFPVLAKNIDNFLHILYQEDGEPGTALTNGDADGVNNINYLKVDATIVLGMKDIKNSNSTILVGQNFPNPFNGTTNFNFNVLKNTDVSIAVKNICAQEVLNVNLGNKAPGVHTVGIDCSKLAPGIYFYTVTAGSESVTKKMIIE